MLGVLCGPNLLPDSMHRVVGLLVFELFPKFGGIHSPPERCTGVGAAVPTLWLLQQFPESIGHALLFWLGAGGSCNSRVRFSAK